MLVPVATLGAFPDQFATVLHDLDLAVESAHLAVITLGVQLGVHDVVVDELDQGYDGGDVPLHIGDLCVTDHAAWRKRLKLGLKRQLSECVDLLTNTNLLYPQFLGISKGIDHLTIHTLLPHMDSQHFPYSISAAQ